MLYHLVFLSKYLVIFLTFLSINSAVTKKKQKKEEKAKSQGENIYTGLPTQKATSKVTPTDQLFFIFTFPCKIITEEVKNKVKA